MWAEERVGAFQAGRCRPAARSGWDEELLWRTYRKDMGCSLSPSEGENRRIHPADSVQVKIEKYKRQLQVEGDTQDYRDRLVLLQVRYTRLQTDIQQKAAELQKLKANEGSSNRNSLKLTRKHTYREASSEEIALREARALAITLEDENSQLQSQLSSSFAVQQEDITDLQLELDELRSDLGKLEAYNQKLVKEKALILFCSGIHINLLLAVSLWKRGNALPARSVADTVDVERIAQEREEMLHSSPIYPTLGKIDFTNVRAMSRISVILLFENLLDEKFDQDQRDLSSNRSPRPVTEFLLEYMSRRHGLQAMATKKLAQFVLGLIGLYSCGNMYAKVMCGMFNIVRQEPMHANFAVFLTHIRWLFQGLKEKRRRPAERQRSSSNAPLPKQDYRREKFVNIDTGGSAPLVFVCDLIYSVFKDFPANGELLLRLIKPAELAIEDFIIFKICHKMAQDGCSPEDLFKRLDLDHGGTIDHSEFQKGIQQLMGLWLSSEDLERAMDRISPGEAEITKEQFARVISFDTYYNSPALREVNVSGADFLLSLMNVYQSVLEECGNAYRSVTNREEIELTDFEAAIRLFDPTQSRLDIVRIYNNVSVEKLNFQAFLDICQSEYLGRFSSFGNSHLDYRKLETETGKSEAARTDLDTPRTKDKKKTFLFR